MKRPPFAVARLAASLTLTIALTLAALPQQVHAEDRNPLDVPARQYLFLLAVALLGGVVSWSARVRAGAASAWNLSGLIGEMATSAFAGLLAFWLCAWSGTPQLLTAALVGIAGHMGTRAIAIFESWAQARFGKADGSGR